MYARIYARIIGVVLIAVGIVGLVLGNRVWLGLLNVDILEDVVHLFHPPGTRRALRLLCLFGRSAWSPLPRAPA